MVEDDKSEKRKSLAGSIQFSSVLCDQSKAFKEISNFALYLLQELKWTKANKVVHVAEIG